MASLAVIIPPLVLQKPIKPALFEGCRLFVFDGLDNYNPVTRSAMLNAMGRQRCTRPKAKQHDDCKGSHLCATAAAAADAAADCACFTAT
jgi:hypothetical protein